MIPGTGLAAESSSRFDKSLCPHAAETSKSAAMEGTLKKTFTMILSPPRWPSMRPFPAQTLAIQQDADVGFERQFCDTAL
jgi:hypothetical protein